MSDDPRDPGPRHSTEPPQTEEERIAQGPAANVEPPGGMATSAGGGHGTGSDKQSSGGTGDAEHPAGDDDPGLVGQRDRDQDRIDCEDDVGELYFCDC